MAKDKINTNEKTTESGFKFTKVRAVTLQLFKWKNGVERYFKLTGTIYQGTVAKDDDDKEPAHLINCIDLESGEEGCFIVGAVMKSTFEEHEAYIDGAYVNKCFAITQNRDPSKKYNTYQIIEIEPSETPNAV